LSWGRKRGKGMVGGNLPGSKSSRNLRRARRGDFTACQEIYRYLPRLPDTQENF